MKVFGSVLAAAFALAASGAEVVRGEKAAAWFPEKVRAAAIADAARWDFAPGVEYGYAYCTNLFGRAGDLHVVRVELAKAAVRPWIDQGAFESNKLRRLSRTSAAAAKTRALFSLNGGFFTWKKLVPYYRMKVRGEVLASEAGGTMGLAFSGDGKRTMVGTVPEKELPDWENFMAGEGLLANGRCALDAKRPPIPAKKPEAPRTFLGMDAGRKYLWAFVTGGRQKGVRKSWGLSYFDASELMAWFGCRDGVNMDGGGSSTLAVRADALPADPASLSPEAHPAQGAKGYWILNATSDGSERAVLDHVQFWDAKSGPAEAK